MRNGQPPLRVFLLMTRSIHVASGAKKKKKRLIGIVLLVQPDRVLELWKRVQWMRERERASFVQGAGHEGFRVALPFDPLSPTRTSILSRTHTHTQYNNNKKRQGHQIVVVVVVVVGRLFILALEDINKNSFLFHRSEDD